MTIAEQLLEELLARATGWGALVGLDVLAILEDRIRDRAASLAGQLDQDEDDRLAAQTVIDVMNVLGDRDDGWYGRTPLGRAVARSTGGFVSESVSFSAAAAMLGVSRTRVQQLVEHGQVDRHPEGGISTASVIARAAERQDHH